MSAGSAGLLVFLSSAAVLVLEILAGRVLAPFVGVTLETYTAVIGVVLAGIALGASWGGRLADRMDPRRLLGPLLVAGGALALLTVPVVLFLGSALRGGGPAAVVILATAGFLPPALALSAVPPAVVKLRLRDLGETGQVVGRLSALGTAGAIAGTFVTGFVLVATIPTKRIILAVGVMLVVGGLLLHRRLTRDVEDDGASPDRRIAVFAAVGLLGTGLTGVAQPPCDVESAYYCAQVVSEPGDPSRRTLILDGLHHSAVDLDDPTHLDFHYMRWFAAAVQARWPGDSGLIALHVGGGGFAMPRWLDAVRPRSQSTVLEIDPALAELAEQELGLEQGPDLQVRVGDARTELDFTGDEVADLIVGDAFGGLAVPWHLTTHEFLTELRRVLKPGGVYMMNVIDGPPYGFARAEAATLRAVFPYVGMITTPDRLRNAGGNIVLLASTEPLPMRRIEQLLDREGDVALLDQAPLAEWSRDGMVLTDDHAPVDQLLGYGG